MRHPAAILPSLHRGSFDDQKGKHYALIGPNPYMISLFRRFLSRHSTSIVEEIVEPTDVREVALRLNDTLKTIPFAWERPMVWISGADHLFANMAFPDDFPASKHIVVCCSESEETYIPASFIQVAVAMKGTQLQEFIRWLLSYKGLSSDIEVIRFLAGEFKSELPSLEKLVDQLYLRIHPRTILTMKDLESSSSMEWDCETILQAIVAQDEGKALKEIHLALETFHPKGIVTVLSRRVQLLIQVASAVVLSGGSPDPGGDIKPWVWRNNVELVKTIPYQKLFKWSVALDKAYATLSRGSISYRWTLVSMIAEMSRI